MNDTERQRRHDERFQKELLDGLARLLDVLHDISDATSALASDPERAGGPRPAEAQSAPPESHLYTTKELAERLNVSPSTIYSWRDSGHGPTPTKIGTALRFQQVDVEEWLSESRERDAPHTKLWRDAYTPGRIGSSHPATSEVRKDAWCDGSHTEPKAASSYTGRGVCRVCSDDVLINRDGALRKHRRWRWI